MAQVLTHAANQRAISVNKMCQSCVQSIGHQLMQSASVSLSLSLCALIIFWERRRLIKKPFPSHIRVRTYSCIKMQFDPTHHCDTKGRDGRTSFLPPRRAEKMPPSDFYTWYFHGRLLWSRVYFNTLLQATWQAEIFILVIKAASVSMDWIFPPPRAAAAAASLSLLSSTFRSPRPSLFAFWLWSPATDTAFFYN